MMGLTAKEIRTLTKLREKEKEEVSQLTDAEIELIENNIDKCYDMQAENIEMLGIAMNGWSKKLSILANDNAKLITEIRRLKAMNTKEQSNNA